MISKPEVSFGRGSGVGDTTLSLSPRAAIRSPGAEIPVSIVLIL